MGTPADHAALLRRNGYPVPAGVDFDPAERALLARYGHWLEALAGGTIEPHTPDQWQFVRVARGEAEPRTAFERAWARCQWADPDPANVPALLAWFQAARADAAAVRAEHAARRDEVIAPVRARLDAVDAAFAGRTRAADEEVARREAAVRAGVLAGGRSVRHAGVYATYSRGRVTWDGKGLDEYAKSHPAAAAFRRVGAPTVSLRFPPADPTPATPPVAVTPARG